MKSDLLAEPKRFQILSLSGGGYRGLYTARILADLEDHIGEPIGSHFDLIAGTSIGGILALAIASGIPAARLVELFENHGSEIFSKQRGAWRGLRKASYTASRLASLLERDDLFGDGTMLTGVNGNIDLTQGQVKGAADTG